MAMTPEECDRIRNKAAEIRAIAEDFNRVHLRRLLQLAPDLRICLLPSLSDDGERLCRTLDVMLRLLPGGFADIEGVSALRDEVIGDPHRLSFLGFDAFIWAMERCFGDGFTPEDRAAFVVLSHTVAEAITKYNATLAKKPRAAIGP